MSKSTRGLGIFFIVILTLAISVASVVLISGLASYFDAEKAINEAETNPPADGENNSLGNAIGQAITIAIMTFSGICDLLLIITFAFLVFNFQKLRNGAAKKWQIVTMLCAYIGIIIAILFVWIFTDFPLGLTIAMCSIYLLLVLYSALSLRDFKRTSEKLLEQ